MVVKITIVAALATILVRYHRFRHILISERRAWPERLLFAFSLGVPLAAGVASRLLLSYDAADLTLEGAFLAGLIAGPYAGALVGLMVAAPALLAGEFIALFFAVGCGFAGGGLREACPNKEHIWHFSPFIFTKLHRHIWRMVRNLKVDWAVILLLAPVALELLRQTLGWRFNSPDGVKSVGDNEFESTDSTAWQAGVAQEQGFGTLRAGMIEMSNVDLSQQFSDLVIMQRGYQACSQVVSTANEMLSELFAMKGK